MDSYRGMDREALDRAYNNVAAVPDVRDKMADFARRSAAIYESVGVKKDLAYGEGARQRIDWIPSPRVGAPTLAFIHGGYWQSLSKEQFAHIAAGPLAHGYNVALIEYTLAPEARIGAIVNEIGRSISWQPIPGNGGPIPRASALRAIPPAAISRLGIAPIRRSHSCSGSAASTISHQSGSAI
jgi:arylformamidase